MKRSLIPAICSCALAAMSAATLGHWYAMREFRRTFTDPAVWSIPNPIPNPRTPLVAAYAPVQSAPLAGLLSVTNPASSAPSAPPSSAQKEFFVSLLDEMKQLKQANGALCDQMAETNRDLMQLEFRVDTQSASFRPLPITEELSSLDPSSLDTSNPGPGVLPPAP
ncbi:MAG: hypothetical protein WCJ66_01045 [Verrucomicrobiota bacterium]